MFEIVFVALVALSTVATLILLVWFGIVIFGGEDLPYDDEEL